jgi:2-polyprenyl-6-methoxyphenol hydroxylase-like FAD-dependent oxidoreductase
MAAVKRVGIVGAGAAGIAAGILLADAGIAVEIIERREGPGRLGSGITLQGNGLRILRSLGVWEEVAGRGYAFSTLGLRAANAEATVLAVLEDIRTGGEDLPATVGMYRPELAEIMHKRAEEAGVRFTFGRAVTALEDNGNDVAVTLDDGAVRRYDLLIGADGLQSTVRRLVGIDIQPAPVGMGIWRAFVPRPDEVVRTDLYYGGPCFIAGYCPTGEDSMYAYLVEAAQDRDEADGPAIMKELAAHYGGPWTDIRENLDHSARINYTHFTSHLVDGHWNRGRVVLIGDAAHSCPPTIAQGASMALEDASVLAELLLAADEVGEELWQNFSHRRLPRARKVVDASLQLARWQLEHVPDADAPGLIASVAHLVAEPA